MSRKAFPSTAFAVGLILASAQALAEGYTVNDRLEMLQLVEAALEAPLPTAAPTATDSDALAPLFHTAGYTTLAPLAAEDAAAVEEGDAAILYCGGTPTAACIVAFKAANK